MSEPNQPRCPKASVRPLAESAVPYWVAVAPKAHTLEDVLRPGYLAERLKAIAPGTVVAIHHEARRYFAELLVVAVDKDAEALAFVPLRVIDLSEAEVLASDWSEAVVVDGGERGWSVKLGARTARVGFKLRARPRRSWMPSRCWRAAARHRHEWHRSPPSSAASVGSPNSRLRARAPPPEEGEHAAGPEMAATRRLQIPFGGGLR